MVDKTYLKLYRPTVIYLHRVQVTYLFPNSDYVYRTFKVFFNSIRRYIVSGEVPKPLKGYSVSFLRGWRLNDNMRWNNRKYKFGIVNSDLGLLMFTKGPLREDKPIIVAFYGEPWKEKRDEAFSAFRVASAASSNDRPELGPEPTVIQISKRWDKETGKLLGTSVNVFFTGDPEKNLDVKIINWLFGLMFREIEWREIAERKLTRIEQFIRIPSVVEEEIVVVDEKSGEKRVEKRVRYLEEEVKEIINLIVKKYGVPADVNLRNEDKLHEDDEGNRRMVSRVNRGMFCYFATGYRVDIKIYRKKRFKIPEEHYTDHPKVEVVHYDIDDWRDVRAVKKEGREILASIVEVLKAHKYVIPDPDHPISGKAFANPLIVNSILKEDLLKKMGEYELIMRFGLKDKELLIISELLRRGRLTSDELKEIGEALGVELRTVQYYLKKLRKKGLVLGFRRGNKNKYYYLFNFDALISEEEEQGEVEVQTQIDEATYYAAKAELERLAMNDNIGRAYILIKYGFNTTRAISKVLGVSERQVRNYLSVLKKKGLIKPRRVGRKVFYYVADYESLMSGAGAPGEEDSLGLGLGGVGVGQVVGSKPGKKGGYEGVGFGAGAANVGAGSGQQAQVPSSAVGQQRVVGPQEKGKTPSVLKGEGLSEQGKSGGLCGSAGWDPGGIREKSSER